MNRRNASTSVVRARLRRYVAEMSGSLVLSMLLVLDCCVLEEWYEEKEAAAVVIFL